MFFTLAMVKVIEWNMKVKIEISICTGLMLNDHSNPYIESTTVLSDIYMYLVIGRFLAVALIGYIFVNPFTSCVTDRYQHKQCIIMETETETNMKICMYRNFIGCVCNIHVHVCCYIFVNPFRYLPQQYIIMQTIKRLPYIKYPW